MKIHIQPDFRGPDSGEGGIRRIVESQKKWLPKFGVEVVPDLAQADLLATHAGSIGEATSWLPWVVHTHGLYWREYQWPRWCHDLNGQVIEAIRRSDHVTAPSEWVAQVLRRGMWLDPTVLHHGVDLDEWKPAPTDGRYILWNKNRPDPICDPRPVYDLAAAAPDLSFVTTFGQEQSNVRVTDRVSFDTMRDLVRAAGVYLATTRETFGIGTIEAMAAAVPVVGWAWGGQREIINHGQTGWLCAPGDIKGLEEGVRWALANRKEIGDNARQAVIERWTWEHRMPPYVDLYKAVLAGKSQRYTGPRVSVVMACYNLGRYLPQAVASLQAQTMKDWELIIVDDASPDDTPTIAAELAAGDARIRVMRNEQNLYLAGTLNTGIEAARGRFILPLDADNMLEPWTLEVLADALDRERRIHIAYGACRFVLEDGVTPDTAVSADGVSGWPKAFSFAAQVQLRNQIPSTCMFRREVWERSGGYRRRCRTAEDAEYWTRVSSLGFVPVRVTSRTTLIYRQRADSMSRVEADWDWSAWFPWSRQKALVPFGVGEKPPADYNGGIAWSVPSYEPPRVVVVIPVGPGHADLVVDALDSVWGQTSQQWECVVVNDTGEPLRIPHTWAKVIDIGPGAGPARARNLAIAASSAPLVLPLDADDYLQPEALEVMLQAWDDGGGVIYSQWYDDQGNGDVSVYDPPDYDAQLLVARGAIHAVTALYPRAALEEVGGFDEDLSHWEDWDLQLKMAKIAVCGTKIPRPLFTYRKNAGRRREANMAAFDQGKEAILAKWSRVWDGKETLMGCTGCGGGGGKRYAPPPAAQRSSGGSAAFAPRPGYVVLVYHGASTSTRMYKGATTGTGYRFGNNPGARVKYVYESDVPGFMQFRDGGRPLFEIVKPPPPPPAPRGDVQLDALGPPAREESPVAPPAAVPVGAGVGNGVPEEAPTEPTTYSTRELRTQVVIWDDADVALHLAHELRQPTPRPTALAILEARLRSR